MESKDQEDGEKGRGTWEDLKAGLLAGRRGAGLTAKVSQ